MKAERGRPGHIEEVEGEFWQRPGSHPKIFKLYINMKAVKSAV
jgi:hypothetical protein